MIINLVLFFIPKRQEIYRLYLIKKRKKLAYMRLNSKRKRECVFANSVRFPLDIYQSAILMGTVNSSDANLFLITRTYTNAITIKVITGTSNHGITGEFDKTTSLTTLKFIGNNSAVILY